MNHRLVRYVEVNLYAKITEFEFENRSSILYVDLTLLLLPRGCVADQKVLSRCTNKIPVTAKRKGHDHNTRVHKTFMKDSLNTHI